MIKKVCLVSHQEEIEHIKNGNNNLEVWNIVLDIEERYAKAMEVMFND